MDTNHINDRERVMQLLPRLHEAATDHRFMGERIDALPPECRLAARALYHIRLDAVQKAIEDLRDNQQDALLKAKGIGPDTALDEIRNLLNTDAQ